MMTSIIHVPKSDFRIAGPLILIFVAGPGEVEGGVALVSSTRFRASANAAAVCAPVQCGFGGSGSELSGLGAKPCV
jgi:hypothetical protein